mmetsp:Transcript_105886/g.299313  ORF Transcript_105886/g.299313 Transcript_105886/m.299313 type:complete len:115 (-) Transcript_105886:48-392(-)
MQPHRPHTQDGHVDICQKEGVSGGACHSRISAPRARSDPPRLPACYLPRVASPGSQAGADLHSVDPMPPLNTTGSLRKRTVELAATAHFNELAIFDAAAHELNPRTLGGSCRVY